jgi:outer membrane protein assembly factor BamB
VPLGDGRVFLTGGYGTGSVMLRLKREGGRFAAEEVLRLEAKEFSAENHTPVYYGGYLYGIMAKEAGALGNQLACLDPSGRLLWSSGRENRFGLGPFMVADGLILALEEKGTLVLAEASPKGYAPLAQAKVLADGYEAWGPLALAGGRLILRDLTRLVCLDLRADRGAATSVASTGAAAGGGPDE